ncbi:SseB family protein [Methanobrevibacter sp.]|uniref:SseB family protein n=1 Tax=Methanobrevibacter sp. TaxID=66852 RepID=UPI0025FACAC0|nr:SseB family protein [Methanobrevibacter sp.]MBQ2831179.1 SseB family protein [Methanobrevibacter sp.]
MIMHKHLRVVIEDIYLNNNEITESLLLKLINEFRYSNLYIPAKREDGTLNFIIYEDDGIKITPLFTDLDEFRKFFKGEDIEALSNSFELYRNVLKTSEIEGYILNPASEKYLFKKEFILSIENVPKTSFYSSNPYSKEELKAMFDSIDNASLEEFIEKGHNIGDYESLFERLSNSDILALMLSDIAFDDEIIDMQRTGPVAGMYMDNVGGTYATIFSSREKMTSVNAPKHKYAQLINLATLVNFVLSEDMDGIVLNPGTDNVLIPRSELLKYSLGFERYANDERLSNSIYYIFKI